MLRATTSDEQNGCVLILSNEIDHSSSHEIYAEMMKDLWCDKVGCKLFGDEIYLNRDGQQMLSLFEQLAKIDTSAFDYLVVVLISRGGLVESKPEGTYRPAISGSDDKWVLEESIFSMFHNQNASWRGKPKLLLLGYNRFDKIDDAADKIINTDKKAMRKESSIGRKRRYPTISDFLLVYGSSTALIEEVYDIFSANWSKQTVLNMLTMVNERMWKDEPVIRKSGFESSIAASFTLYTNRKKKNNVDGNRNINEHFGQIAERYHRKEFYGKTGIEMLTRDVFLHFMKAFPPGTPVAEIIKQMQGQEAAFDVGNVPRKANVLMISNDLHNNKENHIEDVEMMQTLWQDTLKSKFTAHIDKTATEMTSHLKDFSKAADAGSYDYAVVIISAHGRLNKIDVNQESMKPYVSRVCPVGVRGELVEERKIFSMFNEPDSPWKDKVKIFIMDYCRGYGKDLGQEEKARPEPEEVHFPVNDAFLPSNVTSMIKNSFVIYATHAEYVAYTNLLTTAISDVFTKYWKSKSMVEMLTLVNKEMKGGISRRAKYIAMSVFKSTATRDFYLYQPSTIESGRAEAND